MQALWYMLVYTPWWVYLLLAYLLYIGYRASKTRVRSLKKLLIAPVIFTWLSIDTLFRSLQFNALSVSSWIISIVIGAVIGFWLIYRLSLEVDKKHWLIKTPGSWSTLILVVIIFATKYYFGYSLGIDPQKANQTGFEIAMLGSSGICTGIFIGRFIGYFMEFYKGPHRDLV